MPLAHDLLCDIVRGYLHRSPAQGTSVVHKNNGLEISVSLAENMDQSIGEATTLMGAVISELVRRSLRNGVLKIGEELQTFVTGEVETTLTNRMPEMERAAIEAAEQTAQLAAAKVAAEEVHALDVKTGEVTRQLATQIDQVGREARNVVEEKAQLLAGQIQEVDRRAGETVRQTAEELSGKIEETEKRVCATTQADIEQRLARMLEKSREATTLVKARLKAVEELSERLSQEMSQEQTSRKSEMQAGFTRLQQGLDQLRETLSQGLQQCQTRLREEVAELRKANTELAARVTALEQPKGFFARFFRKRKEKGEAGETEA